MYRSYLRSTPFRDYLMLDMNFVIRMLVLSDVVWMGACGLLGPIFAIFVVGFIQGGSEIVAGVAASIYLITKSVVQVPVATVIDRIRGERDDFWFMFVGSALGALIPLAYIFIETPGQLYAVQFAYGLVIAATVPSFMAIFTRHIDKKKEATSWGVYFTLNDLSAAAAASIGGVLAATMGFRPLIVIVVAVSVCGVVCLLPIRKHLNTVGAAPAVEG